jgi:hypothetical protein
MIWIFAIEGAALVILWLAVTRIALIQNRNERLLLLLCASASKDLVTELEELSETQMKLRNS